MKRSLYLVVPVFLLLLSCGDLKTTSYFSPTSTKLSEFNALEIHDFETKIENVPAEALSKIPEKITEKMKTGSNSFSSVEHGTVSNISSDKTVVLLGEITDYTSAGDVDYEGGALKFGEVRVTLSLALVNKATGDEIATGEVNSFSSLGFFEGNVFGNKLYDQIAEEVVNFVNKNRI